MSNRVFNFSAGPAMLPTEVLEVRQGAARLSGQGLRHRRVQPPRQGVRRRHRRGDHALQAAARPRRHARRAVPAGRRDAAVHAHPDELPAHGSADYLVSGEWSKKAASFGKELRQGQRRRHQRGDATSTTRPPPSEWKLIRRRRLLPRLLERDRARPSPADLAEAPEPDRRRQQRVHVPPAPGRATARWSTAARRRTSGPSGVVLAIVRKDLYAEAEEGRRASSGASRTRPRTRA